jgi:hypothetical protein
LHLPRNLLGSPRIIIHTTTTTTRHSIRVSYSSSPSKMMLTPAQPSNRLSRDLEGISTWASGAHILLGGFRRGTASTDTWGMGVRMREHDALWWRGIIADDFGEARLEDDGVVF